jgi:hypothetical protein
MMLYQAFSRCLPFSLRYNVEKDASAKHWFDSLHINTLNILLDKLRQPPPLSTPYCRHDKEHQCEFLRDHPS